MDRLRQELQSLYIVERFRVHAQDFSRDRVLTMMRVVVLILRGHCLSLQNALNTVFLQLQQVYDVATGSAYCQARKKLKPEIFIYLNDLIVKEFYDVDADSQEDPDEEIRRWKGHRLVAVDGSILNLPNSKDLRKHFDRSAGAQTYLTGLAIVSYDVLNHVALGARLQAQSSTTKSFIEHQSHVLEAGDLFLGDREFGDYSLLAWLTAGGHGFVIRLQRNSFAAAQRFLDSEAHDAICTITMPTTQQAFCTEHRLAPQLDLRLVKVLLDTGETELLVTSLLDRQSYPTGVFKELYAQRWGVETYFDHLKNILEVERFSGRSLRHVEQDFYGMVFLTTLEAVLADRPDHQLERRSHERRTQHTQRVNRSVSYNALLNSIIALLLDTRRSTEEVIEEIQRLMMQSPSLVRPGRHYSHKRATYRRQLQHLRYRRRRPS